MGTTCHLLLIRATHIRFQLCQGYDPRKLADSLCRLPSKLRKKDIQNRRIRDYREGPCGWTWMPLRQGKSSISLSSRHRSSWPRPPFDNNTPEHRGGEHRQRIPICANQRRAWGRCICIPGNHVRQVGITYIDRGWATDGQALVEVSSYIACVTICNP